jgi:hypothetical protein
MRRGRTFAYGVEAVFVDFVDKRVKVLERVEFFATSFAMHFIFILVGVLAFWGGCSARPFHNLTILMILLIQSPHSNIIQHSMNRYMIKIKGYISIYLIVHILNPIQY